MKKKYEKVLKEAKGAQKEVQKVYNLLGYKPYEIAPELDGRMNMIHTQYTTMIDALTIAINEGMQVGSVEDYLIDIETSILSAEMLLEDDYIMLANDSSDILVEIDYKSVQFEKHLKLIKGLHKPPQKMLSEVLTW